MYAYKERNVVSNLEKMFFIARNISKFENFIKVIFEAI